MLPDRVSNPGPLTYESGALLIALRGPARTIYGSLRPNMSEESLETSIPYYVCGLIANMKYWIRFSLLFLIYRFGNDQLNFMYRAGSAILFKSI